MKYQGNAIPQNLGSEWQDFKFQVESILSRINTTLPVRVVAVRGNGVNPVGFVDVIPTITQLTADGNPVEHTTISNVPYVRIQGGQNALIVDPVVGDLGYCAFCSRDISAFKNARKDAPPASLRQFSKADCIYLGGILNAAPTNYIQIVGGNKIVVHTPNQLIVECETANVIANKSITATTKTASVTASQSALIRSPTVTVDGHLNITKGMSITGVGSDGRAAVITGDVHVINSQITTSNSNISMNGGDVKADGISLKEHVHGGVQSGGDTTGQPE